MSLVLRSSQWYGWQRDTPDFRDFKFAVAKPTPLPLKVDTRTDDWGIYDQGNIGSCTANATLSAFRHVLHKENLPDFNGSRLAQYYWARYLEGSSKSDSGAQIRDAVKVLTKFGVAPETDWPYITSRVLNGPPHRVSVDAKKHTALQYQSVLGNEHDICNAINVNKNLIIGFAVFDSFESDQVAHTGVVPMPQNTENMLGGHAVELVGYDLSGATKYAIAKNSWGTDWGDKGYFYMPFDYITNQNLAGDFWTLTAVK